MEENFNFGESSVLTTNFTLIINNTLSGFSLFRVNSWRGVLMLSDDFTQKITFVNFVILCTFIAIFGISANVVNVTVFVKQGLPDTVSMSLCILGLADMASLVVLLWIAVCFNPLFQQLPLPFNPLEVIYLTGGFPRHFFTRVTGWITSVVAIERCVCVLKPLHVKLIFTKRRVVVVLVFLFAFTCMTLVPVYYTSRLAWKFDLNLNRTWIGLVFRDGVDRHKLDRVTFILGIIVSISAFGIVSSSTVILGWNLLKQSRWRTKMMDKNRLDQVDDKNSDKAALSSKDKQAVRTVTFIAAMFVICFSPHVINLLLMSIVPDFNKHGKYENIFNVSWSFAQMSEAICSSLNIFIYYKTSTKFKATLNNLIQHIIPRSNSDATCVK